MASGPAPGEKIATGSAAHDMAAYEAKEKQLAIAETVLGQLTEKRLPRYEAAYGALSEVRTVLDKFTVEKAVQETQLKRYQQEREALEAEAPLVIDPGCIDLCLKKYQPEASDAQDLAEEAVADAKAARRIKQKQLRQTEKANEQRLVSETFNRLYPLCRQAKSPPSHT